MRAVTQLGSSGFLIAAGALMAWWLIATRQRRAAWLFVATVAGAELLDQVLKLLFRRPRPHPYLGMPELTSYSFPSGHSIASCCFWGMVAILLTRRMRTPLGKAAVWAAAIVVVILVGLSRIYLGVHYPTDVLGGYLAAVAWLGAVYALGWTRRAD